MFTGRNACAFFERCVESGEKIVLPWYPNWQQYEKAFSDLYDDLPGIRFTPDELWSLFVIKHLEVIVGGLLYRTRLMLSAVFLGVFYSRYER